MKRTTIFFMVHFCVSYCYHDEHQWNGLHEGPSGIRCAHAMKSVGNIDRFFSKEKRNAIMLDDSTVDPNPAKIPSLMDSPESIGFLKPIDIDRADRCFTKPTCDPSAKYRTIYGGCNNLVFPVWGQAHTAHIRIIEGNYSDGISEPRKAVSGRDLPNSRLVRTTIFRDINKESRNTNLYVMQFGQLIAHDTELTMSKASKNGDTLQCCNPDGTTPNILPKGCLQIKIPKNDPGPKKRCLSVPRAADTADLGCNIKPVRQKIGVTSFIDASMLYGSDEKTARNVRTFINGKLKIQSGTNGQTYLSNVHNSTRVCNVLHDNTVCYVSGDERVNQHPNMAVSTISLMRLHNFFCDEFNRMNPSWDDEQLYQEARRLLIAIYQHITYNEYLPILLGRDYARVNKLLPLNQNFDSNYDQFLNPTTISSFTAAAYRSIHSYIQGFVDLVSESRKVTSRIRLSDFYLRSDIIQRRDNYDSFTRGLLTQHAHEQDQFFTEEISEHLFKKRNKSEGLDLISLDLERGRDFGIPSYNSFRQLCGLSEAKTFNDLTDQISQKNVNDLASLYENVNDIDYLVGGLLEHGKPGGTLGHTFQCVVGEMFFRWKFGDRFYYEFGDQPSSFRLDQLNEIRKSTLALIVCMTSNIQSIQQNAFHVHDSKQNPLVPCSSIPNLNLNVWKEI